MSVSKNVSQIFFVLFTLSLSSSMSQAQTKMCNDIYGYGNSSGVAYVQTGCESGYTLKGTLAGVPCTSSACSSADCCDPNVCAPSKVANSNKAAAGSITGTTGANVVVTCNQGYKLNGTASNSSATVVCQTNGFFTKVTCVARACTSGLYVPNSNFKNNPLSGKTLDTQTVTCDENYHVGRQRIDDGLDTIEVSNINMHELKVRMLAATWVQTSLKRVSVTLNNGRILFCNYPTSYINRGTTSHAVLDITCDNGKSLTWTYKTKGTVWTGATFESKPNKYLYDEGYWWSDLFVEETFGVCVQTFPSSFLPTFKNMECSNCVKEGTLDDDDWCMNHKWDAFCFARCKSMCKTQCKDKQHVQIIDVHATVVKETDYTNGTRAGTATCGTNGAFTGVVCVPDYACFENVNVPNSDYAVGVANLEGKPGDSITVTCKPGYSTKKLPKTINVLWSIPFLGQQIQYVNSSDILNFSWVENKQHKVYRFPDQTAFDNCDFTSATVVGFGGSAMTGTTSGIVTTTMGDTTQWYGCPEEDHCQKGTKIQFEPNPRQESAHYTNKINVTCGTNGNKWVTPIDCQPRYCVDKYGNQGDHIDHSNYKEGSQTLNGKIGDSETINCDTGYYACSKSSKNLCTSTSGPSSGRATCSIVGEHARYTGVICAGLPCTNNVNVHRSDYEVGTQNLAGVTGDSIRVTCKSNTMGGNNYHPLGESVRFKDVTCQSNGYWETVNCVDDQNCTAMDINGLDFKEYSSSISSGRCDKGYILKKDLNIPCGADGCQSSECCEPKNCTKRLNVAHSNYKKGLNDMVGTTGTIVEVTCDPGYTMKNNLSTGNATCSWTGAFHMESDCIPKRCSTGLNIPFSDYSSDCCHNFLSCCGGRENCCNNDANKPSLIGSTGDILTVTCQIGYHVSGLPGNRTTTTVCGTNGAFGTVTCAPNTCSEGNVANSDHAIGIRKLTGSVGDEIIVTCSTNFHVKGTTENSAKAKCSAITEKFEGVECVENARCSDINGSGKDFAESECGIGFHLKSNLNIHCANSVCSASACCEANPTCTGFSCAAGYTLIGNPSSKTCAAGTCATNDCCKRNTCTATEVTNSKHYSTTASLKGETGERKLVECALGFHISGSLFVGPPISFATSEYATCETTGIWKKPTCVADQRCNNIGNGVDFGQEPTSTLSIALSSSLSSRRVEAKNGDTLSFTWSGTHNVYKFPDETAFNNCDFTSATQVGTTSPTTAIMGTATEYYGCAISTQCNSGMKLKVSLKSKQICPAGYLVKSDLNIPCVGSVCDISDCCTRKSCIVEGKYNNSNHGAYMLWNFTIGPHFTTTLTKGMAVTQTTSNTMGVGAVLSARALSGNQAGYSIVVIQSSLEQIFEKTSNLIVGPHTISTNALSVPIKTSKTKTLVGLLGDEITISCLPGYDMPSNKAKSGIVICRSDGQWSVKAGSIVENCTNPCKPIKVPHSNFKDTFITGFPGTTQTVLCDAGYHPPVTVSHPISGTLTTTCGLSRTFSAISCDKRTCSPGAAISNSNDLPTNAASGQNGSLTCSVGYSISGPVAGDQIGNRRAVVRCDEDGNFKFWQNNGSFTTPVVALSTVTNRQEWNFQCAPNQCSPLRINNSNYESSPVTGVTGTSITITCDHGFYYTASNSYSTRSHTIKCQTSGLFEPMTCSRVPCSINDEIPNSDHSHSSSSKKQIINTNVNGCGNGRCSECQGECDSDNDCQGSLRCYERSGWNNAPPGCTGSMNHDWDYCYNPYSYNPGGNLAVFEDERVVTCDEGYLTEAYTTWTITLAALGTSITEVQGSSVTQTRSDGTGVGTLSIKLTGVKTNKITFRSMTNQTFDTSAALSIGSSLVPNSLITAVSSFQTGRKKSGTITCQSGETFSKTVVCSPVNCTSNLNVVNSNFAVSAMNKKTGETETVTCNSGFQGSSNRVLESECLETAVIVHGAQVMDKISTLTSGTWFDRPAGCLVKSGGNGAVYFNRRVPLYFSTNDAMSLTSDFSSWTVVEPLTGSTTIKCKCMPSGRFEDSAHSEEALATPIIMDLSSNGEASTKKLTLVHLKEKFNFDTEPFTLEAWVRPSKGYHNSLRYVFGTSGYCLNTDCRGFFGITLNKEGTDACCKMYDMVQSGTNLSPGVCAGAGSIKLNQWQHVACTRDKQSVLRIHVNGEVKNNFTQETLNNRHRIHGLNPHIGQNPKVGNEYMFGSIGSVRAYKTNIYGEEIFTPPTQLSMKDCGNYQTITTVVTKVCYKAVTSHAGWIQILMDRKSGKGYEIVLKSSYFIANEVVFDQCFTSSDISNWKFAVENIYNTDGWTGSIEANNKPMFCVNCQDTKYFRTTSIHVDKDAGSSTDANAKCVNGRRCELTQNETSCFALANIGPSAPACIPQKCFSNHTSVHVLNSNYAPTKKRMIAAIGSSVTVTCDEGYTALNGIDTATCQANKEFTTVICVRNTCTGGLTVPNSNYATTSLVGKFGDQVLVTCNSGYFAGKFGTLTGIATCGENGNFSSVICSPNPTCHAGEHVNNWYSPTSKQRLLYKNIFSSSKLPFSSFVVGGSNSFVLPAGNADNIGVVYKTMGESSLSVGIHTGMAEASLDLRCEYEGRCGGLYNDNRYTVMRSGQVYAIVKFSSSSCSPASNHRGAEKLFDRGKYTDITNDFYEGKTTTCDLKIVFTTPVLINEIRLRPSVGVDNRYTDFKVETLASNTSGTFVLQSDDFVDTSNSNTWPRGPNVKYSETRTWSTKEYPNGKWPFMTDQIKISLKSTGGSVSLENIEILTTNKHKSSLGGTSNYFDYGAPRLIYLPVSTPTKELITSSNDLADNSNFPTTRWRQVQSLVIPQSNSGKEETWLILSNYAIENTDDAKIFHNADHVKLRMKCTVGCVSKFDGRGPEIPTLGNTSMYFPYTGYIRTLYQNVKTADSLTNFQLGGSVAWLVVTDGGSTDANISISGLVSGKHPVSGKINTPTLGKYKWHSRPAHALRVGSDSTKADPIMMAESTDFDSAGWLDTHLFKNIGVGNWLMLVHFRYQDRSRTLIRVISSVASSATETTISYHASTRNFIVGDTVEISGHTGDAANLAMNQIYVVKSITSSTAAKLTGKGMTPGTYSTGVIVALQDFEDSLVAECVDLTPRFHKFEPGKCRTQSNSVQQFDYLLKSSPYTLMSDNSKKFEVDYGTTSEGQRQCMEACINYSADLTGCEMWTTEHESKCAVHLSTALAKGGGGDNNDRITRRCVVKLPSRICQDNDRRSITGNIKSRSDQSGKLEYGGSVSWLLDRKKTPYLVENEPTNLRFNSSAWKYFQFKVRFQSHERSNGAVHSINGNKWRSPGFDTAGAEEGWFLAAKIVGSKSTWNYDSPYWTNNILFDTGDEKKTWSFNVPSNKIKLVFSGNGCNNKHFEYTHNHNEPLSRLFATQRSGGPGRSTWLNMGCNQWPAQSHCNNQGFNIHTADHKIRFGMSMNQENQCSSPDTAVGIGIQPGNIAAGAYYGCCVNSGNAQHYRTNVEVYVWTSLSKHPNNKWRKQDNITDGYPDAYMVKVHDDAVQSLENTPHNIMKDGATTISDKLTTIIENAPRMAGLAILNYRLEGKTVNRVYCCRENATSNAWKTFYYRCNNCNSDSFNHYSYFPWGENEARNYCLSLVPNQWPYKVSGADAFIAGPCPGDEFRENGAKVIVRRGSPLSSSKYCYNCPSGYYIALDNGHTQTSCSKCANGKDTRGQDGWNKRCFPCVAGKFGDDGPECKQCPSGYITEKDGLSACSVCSSGRYSNPTGKYCIDCEVGMHQPFAGNNICLKCKRGSFTLVQGSSRCKFCEAGKYHDNLGSTTLSSASKWTTTGTKGSSNASVANIWKDMIEMRAYSKDQTIVWTDGLSSDVRNACFNFQIIKQDYSYFGWTSRSDVVSHISSAGEYAPFSDLANSWYIAGAPTQVAAHDSSSLQAEKILNSYNLDGKYISLCREIEVNGTEETGIFKFYAGNQSNPNNDASKLIHTFSKAHFLPTDTATDKQNIRPFISSNASYTEIYHHVHMEFTHSACKSCLAGSYSLSNATKCTVCEPGKYHVAKTVNAASCLNCPVGTANHWPQENGRKYHDSLDDCEICQSATFTNTTGARWCKKCPPGKRMKTNVSTSDNHDHEGDCVPEEYTYVCKHKIHAGPGRTEQVSRYCGKTFQSYYSFGDGDYWLKQRDLPEGKYPPRLPATDIDYDIDPAKECSKRCRRAYPTESSEPWVNEDSNIVWKITVTDFYKWNNQYCNVGYNVHNQYWANSCARGKPRTITQPAGQTVVQAGGISGKLVRALIGYPTTVIYVRADAGSKKFDKNKGLTFGTCGAYTGRDSDFDGIPDIGDSSWILKDGNTNPSLASTIWYKKSCYIPPTTYFKLGSSNYYTQNIVQVITDVTSYDIGVSSSIIQNVNHGRITAHSFVVTKSVWTFTISTNTINEASGVIVSQRAKTEDGGNIMKRASGTLETGVSGSVTSIKVTSDPGSLPFNKDNDLIVGDTTVLSSHITNVNEAGGRCRCAEKPDSSSGKLSDGYWSYYFDRNAIQSHPINVGDTLEISVDGGLVHGTKKSFLVDVLTADKWYFTFKNPEDLCIQTFSDWLNSYVLIDEPQITKTVPPMSQWDLYTSKLSDSSKWEKNYLNFVKYPQTFEAVAFRNQFNHWLIQHQAARIAARAGTATGDQLQMVIPGYFEQPYSSSVAEVNSWGSGSSSSHINSVNMLTRGKTWIGQTIKESTFDYCITSARHYTIKRLAGNKNVWYTRDTLDSKAAEMLSKKVVD